MYVLLVAVAMLTAVMWTVRESRRQRLRRIRGEWAQPRDRVHKMEAIVAAHRARLAVTPTAGSMDGRTWDDLNLDAVFAAVDRTDSTLGQHALYHRLRTAPLADHLEAFDALVTRMSTDVPSRERAQLALASLQDANGYDLWWLAEPDAVVTPSWYVVFPLLATSSLLVLVVSGVWWHLLVPVAAALGVAVLIHYLTDNRVSAVAGAFRQLAPVIGTAQSLTFLDGDDIRPIVGALRDELPSLARLKTIARWVGNDPLMLGRDTNLLAIVISDFVGGVVYAYLNLAFFLDANGVYVGARHLRTRASGFLRVLAAIGDIDAAISVASFRAGTDGWTRPRFAPPGAPIVLSEIRHPLVREAVPNSLQLGPPHGVLVTGSNMSGKSTLLRTVGVSAVLAQTIHTCLATNYEAPVFQVRSCIGRADDLLAGKSYYLVEAEALLALVQASRSRLPYLFLLDELFRGTNAIERIAAGEAVLRELVGTQEFTPHLVITATHDGELVDLLRDRYVAYHFGEAIGPGGLTFDYRLVPGPATTRNAIALLQLHGAPDSLIDCARTRAAALDSARAHRSSDDSQVTRRPR